ncbi:hypothetical protein [Bradyrhizobium canariense]|uniref:Uncharacterized protein n=1 Tax=Bradyrhizobium canariense TaxID=255045 RepID=A0A1H1PNR1_9BRAD|nr:hypothetical protein [Bradyrhizobium canariense]SDS12735.1 hypothetical protein SAMN05444158_1094 [Bradyrhizobium canariense]
MDYHEFTNHSLTMMYFGARGALAADDELNRLGEQARFRVRETPSWKRHVADLEVEMFRRGMIFEVIEWTEDDHGASEAIPPPDVTAAAPGSP